MVKRKRKKREKERKRRLRALRKQAEERAMEVGAAIANKGGRRRRLGRTAWNQEQAARASGCAATFRHKEPPYPVQSAGIRDFKAGKRKTKHKTRRKGLDWPNRHIGTKCI